TAELFEGVSAKTSGAGGGDCGIVLAEPWVNAQNIYDTWRQHGIHPLEMAVTQLGARLEEQPWHNLVKTITSGWRPTNKTNSPRNPTPLTTPTLSPPRWPVSTRTAAASPHSSAPARSTP